MRDFDSGLKSVPNAAGVYALYEGKHVVYVGSSKNIRSRLRQHLVTRDSSAVTTGAVRLHADEITSAAWWVDDRFCSKPFLLAAEWKAHELLEPTLRTRTKPPDAKHALSRDDGRAATRLISGEPSGRVSFLGIAEALRRIAELEEQLASREARA